MNLLMLSGDTSVAQGHQGAFYQMLRRFAAHWGRIDIISPQAPGAQPGVLHGNVYLHPATMPRLLHPCCILRQGLALLVERPYALIVSHDFGFFYNGLGACWLSRRTGVPYVSEIHHVEGYPRAATNRERIYRWVAFRYIRRARRSAAAFRTVNAVEVPDLLRRLGIPDEQILVLPSLYIDFEIFHPLDEPMEFDVAFVGRLAANKGLFTLLEAVALVCQTHPAIRLAVVGRGPLRRSVEEAITAQGLTGHVTLIDRIEGAEGMARFYNRARMLVCASTAEGGPRVTVEAMACGVPVITTPVGVMRELVEDGVNGLLFEWDSRQLAGHIRRLLDDEPLRLRLAEAGRLSVQGFRADDVVARYAQGYHDLINRLAGGA